MGRSIPTHMKTSILIGLVSLLAWIGVIAAAMWALVTLNRVRTKVDAVRAQLDRIEQFLTRR